MAQYIVDTSSSPGTVAASFKGATTTPNNPTLIPTSELLQPHISHTFLIRHPNKAVPSYARLCYPGAPTGFDYFDPSEMGYKELRMLFDFIREETGKTPLLVESEELLKAPPKVVKAWCEHVGIEFKEEMLAWDDAPDTRTHLCVSPPLLFVCGKASSPCAMLMLARPPFAAKSGRASMTTRQRARESVRRRRRTKRPTSLPRRRRRPSCRPSCKRPPTTASRTTSTCGRSRRRTSE